MKTTVGGIYLFTQFLAIAALLGLLQLGLLPAFLGGFFVYFLVEFGTRGLEKVGVIPETGKLILVVLLALIVIAGCSVGIFAAVSYISEESDNMVELLKKMSDILAVGRDYLPVWLQAYLPESIEGWQQTASEWLRSNISYFSTIGKDVGVVIFYVAFGMVIGGMIAISPARKLRAPLSRALSERAALLSSAFRRIVFSQIRISALNTFLTAIFLTIILPMTGNPLPFVKTMIVVTFIVGLLPIIGNLISNSIIFLVALSVSPEAAVGSLIFLIIIHKLEYFFNAHIIGTQIKSRAWEILLAMLVMEGVFGIAGLIAAPIYYAYIKDELAAQKLI